MHFTSSPMVGAAAANKGLALFPRRIGGRFAALSRSDRESNTIAFPENPYRWEDAFPCQAPTRSWEVVQLGNCGSPIETEAGWLVLTHGVGPMRTYSIGAILLDSKTPPVSSDSLREPLLSPAPDEQDGYVPNVVYSCGALLHAGTLVMPYGISDSAIGVATVRLDELLASLTAHPIESTSPPPMIGVPPCLTDPRRGLPERSPGSPSRRREKQRRRSEKSETIRPSTGVGALKHGAHCGPRTDFVACPAAPLRTVGALCVAVDRGARVQGSRRDALRHG